MSILSFIRGDDIRAAVDAGSPKSEPWRAVVAKLNEIGVTEAHMPEAGAPVEPWLEKLRGWIMATKMRKAADVAIKAADDYIADLNVTPITLFERTPEEVAALTRELTEAEKKQLGLE